MIGVNISIRSVIITDTDDNRTSTCSRGVVIFQLLNLEQIAYNINSSSTGVFVIIDENLDEVLSSLSNQSNSISVTLHTSNDDSGGSSGTKGDDEHDNDGRYEGNADMKLTFTPAVCQISSTLTEVLLAYTSIDITLSSSDATTCKCFVGFDVKVYDLLYYNPSATIRKKSSRSSSYAHTINDDAQLPDSYYCGKVDRIICSAAPSNNIATAVTSSSTGNNAAVVDEMISMSNGDELMHDIKELILSRMNPCISNDDIIDDVAEDELSIDAIMLDVASKKQGDKSKSNGVVTSSSNVTRSGAGAVKNDRYKNTSKKQVATKKTAITAASGKTSIGGSAIEADADTVFRMKYSKIVPVCSFVKDRTPALLVIDEDTVNNKGITSTTSAVKAATPITKSKKINKLSLGIRSSSSKSSASTTTPPPDIPSSYPLQIRPDPNPIYYIHN